MYQNEDIGRLNYTTESSCFESIQGFNVFPYQGDVNTSKGDRAVIRHSQLKY